MKGGRLGGRLSFNLTVMRYFPLNQELFTANRERFAAKMAEGAVAVFASNDEMPSNGDAHHPWRQSSDLFW